MFSREGLTEENGVISLNELADSLEKVDCQTGCLSIPKSYSPLLLLRAVNICHVIDPCPSNAWRRLCCHFFHLSVRVFVVSRLIVEPLHPPLFTDFLTSFHMAWKCGWFGAYCL